MEKKNNLLKVHLILMMFVSIGLILWAIIAKENWKTEAKAAIHKNDSLTERVSTLTHALNMKMMKMCDTLTIEQRLKYAELDVYVQELDKAKSKDEERAAQEKDRAESKSHKIREVEDAGYWTNYLSALSKAFATFRAQDEEIIREYAFRSLKNEWSDHKYDGWKELEDFVASKPLLKTMVKLKDDNYDVYSSQSAKCTKRSEERNQAISKDYQAKMEAISLYYSGLIAKKKSELGL